MRNIPSITFLNHGIKSNKNTDNKNSYKKPQPIEKHIKSFLLVKMKQTNVFFKINSFLLILTVVSVSSNLELNDNPIIQTKLGPIKGKTLTSRLGAKFQSFRGIRYAKPPINDLRFKNPEKIEAWEEILDATEDGPMCPQPNKHLSDISEDCLRLNIYTKGTTTKKSVLIYIHAGGFYSVSGQSKNFAGPQTLMDRDLVLVTINYRLGSLGFMSTGTSDCPGNFGLKDQVMALKFVRENIEEFGGDPNKITLMGYSVGGASVALHLVSPMSRDLFHRAIVMSASGTTGGWNVPESQLELAQRQGSLVGCSEIDPKNLVSCLKRVDAHVLGNSLPEMFEFGTNDPVLVWKPVVEQDFGQERFLTEDPMIAFRSGNFMRVPIIAGITKDEFFNSAIRTLGRSDLINEMENNFNQVAPICFLYERNTSRSHEISDELREKYFGEKLIDFNGLSKLYSDGLIGFSVDRFVRLVSKYTKVFYYRFSYLGRYSHVYYPDNKPYGVAHHDDLLYLFHVSVVAPMFKQTDPENTIIEKYTRLWARFADNGFVSVFRTNFCFKWFFCRF